jgi:hypothetical protein
LEPLCLSTAVASCPDHTSCLDDGRPPRPPMCPSAQTGHYAPLSCILDRYLLRSWDILNGFGLLSMLFGNEQQICLFQSTKAFWGSEYDCTHERKERGENNLHPGAHSHLFKSHVAVSPQDLDPPPSGGPSGPPVSGTIRRKTRQAKTRTTLSAQKTVETKKNSGWPSPLKLAAPWVPSILERVSTPASFHTHSQEQLSTCPRACTSCQWKSQAFVWQGVLYNRAAE